MSDFSLLNRVRVWLKGNHELFWMWLRGESERVWISWKEFNEIQTKHIEQQLEKMFGGLPVVGDTETDSTTQMGGFPGRVQPLSVEMLDKSKEPVSDENNSDDKGEIL